MMEIKFYSQVTASADTCLFCTSRDSMFENCWTTNMWIKGFYQQEAVFGQTMKKISHFYPGFQTLSTVKEYKLMLTGSWHQ